MKLIEKVGLIIISLILLNSCDICRNTRKNIYIFTKNLKTNPYAYIMFFGLYNDDLMSLYINDTCIFHEQIINNVEKYEKGNSTMLMLGIEKQGKIFKISSFDKDFKIDMEMGMPKKKELNIQIQVNQKNQVNQTFDIHKKRLIVFYKNDEGLLNFYQNWHWTGSD